MSNHSDLEILDIVEAPKRELNYPLFIKLAIAAFFISLLYSLFFGDSSIGVLQDAQKRETSINKEYNTLQNENQKLQKGLFELIQLTPQEDHF